MIIGKIHKFRDRLDKYSDLIPVFCLCSVVIWTGVVFWYKYYMESLGINIDEYETHPLAKYDYLVNSINNISLLALILMFCKSKNYRFISWFCYLWLCCIWLLNEIYVIFDFETDKYYTIFFWFIFPILMFFTTYWLTKNNK